MILLLYLLSSLVIVYESFIGNQEEDSAYYTPLFLVDYILTETVEAYLTSNQETYNCRVLDPACGSGIFLVETLRKIIEKFIFLNPNIKRGF
jgi:type I restriction-modification system DNA methylase subunit